MNAMVIIEKHKALKAKFYGGVKTPVVRVSRAEPEPVETVKAPDAPPAKKILPIDDAALKRQIEESRRMLDGCPMPKRLRLLILPTLQELGLTWTEVMSRSNKPNFVAARRAVWRVLADDGLPFLRIGQYCGRDHTTVLHALGRVSRKRGTTDARD